MDVSTKKHISITIKYILIALAAVIILFPIYEMISTSLKLPVDAFVIPPVWFLHQQSSITKQFYLIQTFLDSSQIVSLLP